MSYRIVRFCFDQGDPQHRTIVASGLSLEEAQEHCNNPETSSRTASDKTLATIGIDDDWFDGYEEE